MLKKRLIPVVLLKNGRIVQSKAFKRHQVLGVPSAIISRLTNWNSDELIFLDISRNYNYDLRRDDLNFENLNNLLDIVHHISKKCFMPLTVGGGIRTLEDIEVRVKSGADKVAINKMAIQDPELIVKAAKVFGSQCIVVSIDVRLVGQEKWNVFTDYGKVDTGIEVRDHAKHVQSLGAGEILINSIDEDGKGNGFDKELVKVVVEAVTIPVIALGGAGDFSHFGECIEYCNPSAISASNIFQYSENSVYNAMKYLYENKFQVRNPTIETITNIGDK